MKTTTKLVAVAAAFATFATPLAAQEEEEPRTTYRIELLNFSDGGSGDWDEVMNEIVNPARASIGLPQVSVHWLMAGEWEIMTITEMPDGLADLDTHGMNRGDELDAAILTHFESEEAAKAKREEITSKITRRMVTYSHTHP